MSKNSFDTVFLDAADTLFYIKDGLGRTYADVAKKFGNNPSPDSIKRSFGRVFKSAPPLAFGDVSHVRRQSLEKMWWKEVVAEVYRDVGDLERFDDYFDELYEVFRTTAWEIYPETIEVLSLLKQKGYRLGIISNFDTRVYDVCLRLGITEHIDCFVISSEAGHAKPAPEIFEIALSKMGVTSSGTIHVGDDIDNDFHGARAVGIDAYLLDREKEHEDNKEVDTISSLHDLLMLLEK